MSGISGIGFPEYNQPGTIANRQAEPLNAPNQAETVDLAGKIGPAYKLDGSLENKVSGSAQDGKTASEVKDLKRTGQIECQTCKNRTYQDGSDDPGVSFKAPGNISPEASVAVVSSHENEHVVNEQAKANKEGRKVISQNVQIFMDICPECGKAYASGGVTKTTTAADNTKDKNSAAENTNENTKENAGETKPAEPTSKEIK